MRAPFRFTVIRLRKDSGWKVIGGNVGCESGGISWITPRGISRVPPILASFANE
jgi:hypothetical protein